MCFEGNGCSYGVVALIDPVAAATVDGWGRCGRKKRDDIRFHNGGIRFPFASGALLLTSSIRGTLMRIIVIALGLVSAAASAQSSSAQFNLAPSISRFSSGNHEGINSRSGGANSLAIGSEGGFAYRSEMTPTMRRQQRSQLDALYREVLQRKAENGGALTDDDRRFLTRKARVIVRANGF